MRLHLILLVALIHQSLMLGFSFMQLLEPTTLAADESSKHKAMLEIFESTIIQEQVIDGLDKAVMNMKKGEVALVTIHPEYAFGSSGSTQELATVLPNSNVYYEVELVSFVKEKECGI
ncbi:peptidyl-prolyl cis-trans isomerase FKBP65-like [Arachis hypogaea]|uniref:peptidyl-prolyl cis-trans isomerase FKBP65-like n=1 Tax=Arachis hypogaea TaxID=3818 RepID=UPI003B223158